MSKTFKSAIIGHPRRLHLEENEHGVNIHASDPEWRDGYGITIATSDAPALALAILEAAGYQEHSKAELGSSELLASYGMTKLRQAVQAQDREESEAEAQAKLEAEALKLINAYRDSMGYTTCYWETVGESDRKNWLAVARRARELNKEKNNA